MDRERAGRTKNRQGQVGKKNGSFSFACLLKGRPTVVVKLPNLWHEGHWFDSRKQPLCLQV